MNGQNPVECISENVAEKKKAMNDTWTEGQGYEREVRERFVWEKRSCEIIERDRFVVQAQFEEFTTNGVVSPAR